MREEFKNIPLHKNEEKKCFEIEIDGSFAFIKYKETSSQIALIHTEVQPALSGKGTANAVVEKTLTYIESTIKNFYHFVHMYLLLFKSIQSTKAL